MEELKIKQLAKNIKLLICDVDGVLTKGELYLDNSSQELKAFNVKDGLGLKLLQKAGVEIAIITGRNSPIVERRMAELGIEHVYQGQRDKIAAYNELLGKLGLNADEVAYIGDDLPDLPLIKRSALGIAVADAHFSTREKANWITFNDGGCGAIRDVTDMILDAKGLLDDIHRGYWEQ